MMRFERRHQKLATPEVYRARLIRSGAFGLFIVAISLVVGMSGYSFFEKLSFLDAFMNAAMILSGMGPVHNPESAGGKVFAGIYALYSGFAVLVITAIMFAPTIHRALHRFHIEDDGQSLDGPKKAKKKP